MARQYRDSYLSFKKAFFCHLVNGWHSLKYKYTLIGLKKISVYKNNKEPGSRKEKELGFGCASLHYKRVKTFYLEKLTVE